MFTGVLVTVTKKWGGDLQYTTAEEWLFKSYYTNAFTFTFYAGIENDYYKTMQRY